MRILKLTFKDLNQIVRDWKSALFLLIMPLLFTLFFGFIFGGGSPKQDVDSRLPVSVINQDEGILAASLEQLLEGSEVIRPVSLNEETVEQYNKMVEDGDLAASIID